MTPQHRNCNVIIMTKPRPVHLHTTIWRLRLKITFKQNLSPYTVRNRNHLQRKKQLDSYQYFVGAQYVKQRDCQQWRALTCDGPLTFGQTTIVVLKIHLHISLKTLLQLIFVDDHLKETPLDLTCRHQLCRHCRRVFQMKTMPVLLVLTSIPVIISARRITNITAKY